MSSNTTKKTSTTPSTKPTFDFAFGKLNYILLVVGIIVIALGYILLIGGGSDDPKVFNYEIFNAQRLVVAPIVMVIGFVIEIFAIMIKPKN